MAKKPKKITIFAHPVTTSLLLGWFFFSFLIACRTCFTASFVTAQLFMKLKFFKWELSAFSLIIWVSYVFNLHPNVRKFKLLTIGLFIYEFINIFKLSWSWLKNIICYIDVNLKFSSWEININISLR